MNDQLRHCKRHPIDTLPLDETSLFQSTSENIAAAEINNIPPSLFVLLYGAFRNPYALAHIVKRKGKMWRDILVGTYEPLIRGYLDNLDSAIVNIATRISARHNFKKR